MYNNTYSISIRTAEPPPLNPLLHFSPLLITVAIRHQDGSKGFAQRTAQSSTARQDPRTPRGTGASSGGHVGPPPPLRGWGRGGCRDLSTEPKDMGSEP